MAKRVCFLISLFLVFHAALGVSYTDCGSKTGTVTKVTVTGCEDSDTCNLKRGTKTGITITFDSKAATTSVTGVVHGIIGGVPLPFALPQPDGCKDSGLTCPLTNGKSYTYTNTLDIKNSYPPFNVKVKYELQDENKDDMVCVEIPSKIV